MYFYFLIITLLVAQGQAGSEKNVTGEVPAPGTPKPGPRDTVCPEGWKKFENNLHCFRAFYLLLPHDKARKNCQEKGGDLAQPDSESKNKFLRPLFPETVSFWIGVVYEKEGKKWTYVDGTPLKYSNWKNGEPNVTIELPVCAAMINVDHWNSSSCETSIPFVCEKDAAPTKHALKNQMVKLEEELKSNEVADEKKLQDLEDNIKKANEDHKTKLRFLQGIVHEGEVMANKTVFFAATHNRRGKFYRGAKLIFSDVYENVGGGYNKDTRGSFTAPITGFYFISLSVFTSPKQHIFVDLKNQRGTILATLRSGDGAGWVGQGKTTCIVKLSAGNRVFPVISQLDGRSPIARRYSGDRLNMFYGYLLRAM